MSAAKRRFFSGNTVEQALVQAAGYFQIEPDRLAYRQIEKKHGFVRTRGRVVIEVDPENPTSKPKSVLADARPAAQSASEPSRPETKAAAPAIEAKPEVPAAEGKPEAPADLSRSAKELQEEAAEEIGRARNEAAAAGPEAVEAETSSSDETEVPAEEPEDEKQEEGGGSAWWRAVHSAEEGEEDEPSDDDEDDDDEYDDDDDDADEDEDEDDDLDDDDEEGEEISDDEVIAGAEDAMERILRLAGLDLDCTVTLEDETIYADLTGPDRGVLLDEDADLLQSIEMLLPRVMRGLVGDSFPCRVDSEGFRRKRETELQGLARKAAEVVREGVQAVTLEPMNPAERRIVHMALADAKDVKTESEGDGYFKQVVILRS